ncbi:MAG TPA: DNA glycosylase [Desulfobulbaceae bacterium]|nr:DNA glycosylase [Desulfobulbaceae bacterium]
MRDTSFEHCHPYAIFIPEGTSKVIVGTLPPPRFSFGELREKDVDFCYGSCDGMLWRILAEIFRVSFRYENSPEAVRERQDFLQTHQLGICDIVESCSRVKNDASDLGMQDIRLRDIVEQIRLHPSIDTLLFTGGNTKNGPEYLFRRLLRNYGLQLRCIVDRTPRVHTLAVAGRVITTVSLTSPSNAANKAIGSNPLFKEGKRVNPAYSTFEFRVDQYRKVFLGQN